MKFLAKDFKKIVTFINKIFTDNEKKNYSINLKKENDIIYIIYENDDGLIFSKKLCLIEPDESSLNVKIRISEFINYNKFTKEVQVLDLVIKDEEQLTGYIYDENKQVISLFNIFEGVDYDMQSIYNEEVIYKVNTNIMSNVSNNINSITKTAYYKDSDVSFNNVIDFIFNSELKLYVNNGIVLGKRKIKPLTFNSDKEITGQISISNFKLANKWLNVATAKDIDISFNDYFMILRSDDMMISIPIDINNNNLGIIHLYEKMIMTLLEGENVFELYLDDFVSKYNNKLLVQDTILNINEESSEFKISMKALKDNYSYPGNQIKNIVSPLEEEAVIHILKNYNNPMIVKFDDDGCNVINKIKSQDI